MAEVDAKHFQVEGRRIWVAGHGGMVGSALLRRLSAEGCQVLIANRAQLDLRHQTDVEEWLRKNRPDAVIIAAAKVGGILANDTMPVDFLYDNLAIASNIIHGAAAAGVAKLVFLGAACQYPVNAPQPISEVSLLQGKPEPTNEWYSVAKIAGVKLCQAYRKQHGRDFITIVPSNLYGPNDKFDQQTSHVVPSLILKAHEAKRNNTKFTIWGTGKPLREFMYVDDCADAIIYLLKNYSADLPINVGSGDEISIESLAREVSDVVGNTAGVQFDMAKPDGAPRKVLDSTRIRAMGWHPTVPLHEGLVKTYQWFIEHQLRG